MRGYVWVRVGQSGSVLSQPSIKNSCSDIAMCAEWWALDVNCYQMNKKSSPGIRRLYLNECTRYDSHFICVRDVLLALDFHF